MERTYLLRVTRHPLTPDEITSMEATGTLPDDHKSRSVTAHDFVKTTARDDSAARSDALAKTKLVVKGERTTVEEVVRGGKFRELEPEEDR